MSVTLVTVWKKYSAIFLNKARVHFTEQKSNVKMPVGGGLTNHKVLTWPPLESRADMAKN